MLISLSLNNRKPLNFCNLKLFISIISIHIPNFKLHFSSIDVESFSDKINTYKTLTLFSKNLSLVPSRKNRTKKRDRNCFLSKNKFNVISINSISIFTYSAHIIVLQFLSHKFPNERRLPNSCVSQ